MDFLNQFAKQIADLFRSMTPGSRVAVGLLLAVLGVSLFFLFTSKVAQSGDYLFGGTAFDQGQANRMIAAFGMEGLSGESVPTGEGFKIKVKGDSAPYMAALVKNDALPPDCYDYVREALNDTSITQSPKEFRELIQNAKSSDLKQIFRNMSNISWAQVMYYRGERRNFMGQEKSSAAIVVKPKPGEMITARWARTIQQTASGSLGIPAADITVTDAATGHCFSGDLDSGQTADLEIKSSYESMWRERIRDLLNIVGLTVAVNVELDPYEKRETFTVKPNKKEVVAAESYSKSNKTDKKSPGPMGRPGLTANAPRQLAVTGSTMMTESDKGSESINKNLIGRQDEATEYAAGREERVSVSIMIPTEHYVNIWKSRNPTPEGEEAKEPTAAELATIETEEIDKAKKAVTTLIGAKGIQDAEKFVNVASYQSFMPAPAEEISITVQMTSWLSKYWTVVGLFMLAFLSLRVLRSVMREVPVEIGESGGKKGGKEGAESGLTEEESKEIASEMLKRFEGSPHSLRDELSTLVKQDTDAAATILRSWIGTPLKSS